MNNDSKVIHISEWTIRIREPEGAGPHPLILLLHGWTGDENSMWIFASRLPDDALLVAPRGLHKTPLGGYGWHPHRLGAWPDLNAFEPAIHALLDLMTAENFPQADFSRMRMAGFSQGAALTYAFALEHPERVVSFAGLSGFMPQKAEPLITDHPLQGKQVFVAHGTQDELVPVARARQSVGQLGEAGAQVTYCEDDVGHKLSATCFHGLQDFFAGQRNGG